MDYCGEFFGGGESAPTGERAGVKREGNLGKFIVYTAFLHELKTKPDCSMYIPFDQRFGANFKNPIFC